MDKIKDIAALLFACGDSRPDAFVPAHSGMAASTLRNTAVDYRMAYIPLSAIICRLKRRLSKN